MHSTLHTFIAHVEDKPGVLNRVVSLFRRRGYNIESLTVGRTHEQGVSRLTMLVDADEDTARRIEAHLYKLVNVLRVQDITQVPSVVRDLALIKVKAGAAERAEILEICKVFRARVVDIGSEALIVEITGEQEKIDGLAVLLKPFGILEMVNSGVVAMTRSAEEATAVRNGAASKEVASSAA
jgi:acetolactate synthase-1/3 small subunit